MSEEAAGYAVLAERLGRVRRVFTGTHGSLLIVDGDGGSSPAQRGATALAFVNPAGYYDCAGDDPDEAVSPYAIALAGSGPEQCPECGKPDFRDAGVCIADLERQVKTMEQLARVNNRAIETLLAELAIERSERAALADRVAALELKRCVE